MFIFQTLKNEKEALNLDRSIFYSSYWFKDNDYIIPSQMNSIQLNIKVNTLNCNKIVKNSTHYTSL